MKKIWQKSLASMVSAALCLTAFVGCLTVNAATAYTGTIASTGATVAPTDAEATVNVTLASEALANTVAVQISSKYGALTAVKEVDTATEYYVDQDEIKLDEGKFFVHAKTNAADKGFATAELVLTFAKAADVVEKDYEINIKAFAGHDGATYNEDTIDYFAANPIYIKVASSHTHVWSDPYMDTVDGKWYKECSCGEKVETTANIVNTMGVSRSIIIAEKIGIKFTVQASAQANALNLYDDYFIRVNTQSYNGNYNLDDVSLDIASNDTYDVTSSLISYSYMNVTSYELTIPVNATVYYVKDGKIVACSKTYTDTLADRAMTFAKKYDYTDLTSPSAKEGAMYLNLIKYGIEAQKYFAASHSTADIANATLPTFESGYENYVTTDVPQLTEIKSNVKAEGVSAGMSRNVVVGASNALVYKLQITSTSNPSNVDISKLTLEITYTSSASKIGTVTEVINLSDIEPSNNLYQYSFDKIAVYDLNQVVTAKLYSADSTEPLITNTYSVETNAKSNIDSGKNTDFWQAMVIFGHSARAFFGYE